MKILHFIPGYNFGGIETIFKKMLIYKDNEMNLEVIVENKTPTDKIIELEKLGCRVHIIPKIKLKNVHVYINAIDQVFKKIGKVDIVHSYAVTRSFLFFNIAEKYNVKHRILHARADKLDGNYLKQKLSKFFLKLGVNKATYRLANSTNSGDFFYGNKSYKIVNNGIDTEEYFYDHSVREVVRDKINVKSEEVVLGHVGRFTYLKNHTFILQLFNEFQLRVPNSKLLLVGNGPEYDSIIKQIEKFKLSDKVILVGEQIETSKFYQAMDIFIFPSLSEGFGNVAIEAQSSGLKVIASTGVPEEVNITDLVTFHSLDENINVWIDTIINNLEYERKSNKIRLLNSGYDIKNHVKEISKVYYELYSDTEDDLKLINGKNKDR